MVCRPGNGRGWGWASATAKRQRSNTEEGDPVVHIPQGRPAGGRGWREQGEADGRHLYMGRGVPESRPGHSVWTHSGRQLHVTSVPLYSMCELILASENQFEGSNTWAWGNPPSLLIPSLPHLLLYLLVCYFFLFYSLHLFFCFCITFHYTRIVPLCFQARCRRMFFVCWFCVICIFRSTPPSQPNKVGLKCPSVCPQKVSSISMKFVM